MSPLRTFLRGSALRPNAAPAPLRITLARRLVETPGAPFVSSEEVFTDVASARDELGLLPGAQGPTVVRVQVEGGTASALEGDWLVDPDGRDRVARLPVPLWDYSIEATEWARARPWPEAWETCSDARWMLHAARKTSINRRLLVLAACACARTALPFVPTGEERPLRAIEAAERWVHEESNILEVKAAADDARNASNEAYAADADGPRGNHLAAAWAADSAAYAAAYGDVDDAARWPSAAYGAAAHAATRSAAHAAGRAAYAAASALALARCADLVRREIPTLVVLRAVATRV